MEELTTAEIAACIGCTAHSAALDQEWQAACIAASHSSLCSECERFDRTWHYRSMEAETGEIVLEAMKLQVPL